MTTRKDFLVAGTLAAATIPASALADAPAAARPKAQKLSFDLEAFDALLDGAQAHKHLFAAVQIEGGEVFSAMRNTLNAYRDIGVDWSDVLPVAVLYHGFSILLAFDDLVWNRYIIPLAAKLKHANGAAQIASVRKSAGGGNPCLREQGGEWDTSIRSLVADAGARFFVCNNAAIGIAALTAKTLGKSSDDVYNDFAHHLVPNAMLVPAGVWAVHAIQEQRFTLLQTSLAPPK
ncbi:MAG TPA: hypothetical protein VMV65_03390 [Alphaproteobacteria bacterium]|nr:hypothetical protein [Alphaproteobacteria bacterium]